MVCDHMAHISLQEFEKLLKSAVAGSRLSQRKMEELVKLAMKNMQVSCTSPLRRFYRAAMLMFSCMIRMTLRWSRRFTEHTRRWRRAPKYPACIYLTR